MPDEIKTNLESIEESDLDLERKFKEGVDMAETKVENVVIPEQKAEAKENTKEKEQFYSQILSKAVAQTMPQDDNTVNDDAEVLSKEKDVEGKIQGLVSIAENKGVVHAVKVARHLEDNYVLDELHDRLLSEELHNALLQKGLIKRTNKRIIIYGF
jgi:hypothetical protein